jgi:hypothetical protein
MTRRTVLALSALVLLAALTGAACRSGTDGKERPPMPARDIQTVQEAHAPTLMALDGVVGVAIGETDDRTPCVVIYVREMTKALRTKLPTSLEGYPVRVEVSGEIRPLGR